MAGEVEGEKLVGLDAGRAQPGETMREVEAAVFAADRKAGFLKALEIAIDGAHRDTTSFGVLPNDDAAAAFDQRVVERNQPRELSSLSPGTRGHSVKIVISRVPHHWIR